MGRIGNSGKLVTFFGESEAVDTRDQTDGSLDVAKLSEALASAAQEAINKGFVGPGKSAWFTLTQIEVELANQHPKTVRVGVTLKDPQPS